MSIKGLLKQSRENYVTTLSKLFEMSTDTFARRPLSQFVGGGQEYTYETFKHKCLELSHRFNRFGISAGDKVAILSNNMPNWTVAMFSCVPFGRVTVPILPDSSESEVSNILIHSGCKAIFISKRLLKKLSDEVKDRLTLVIDIETFEFIKKDDLAFTCEGHSSEPQADDLASIIYTSGTSGNAKGVMLSHRNFCQNIIAAFHAQPAGKKDRWLSILPMSHTYEMAFSVLYPLFVGGCVYYIKKPPTPSILLEAMKKVRPTIMCAVPLIIEKIYRNSVVPTIEKSRTLSWMQEKMPRVLYWLIGKKLYKTFGGKLKFFGIGGSKLDSTVDQVLALVIIIDASEKAQEGIFGLLTVDILPGGAGNIRTGEGEIVAKGDNVMLGYYRDPERTRAALTDDGWFRTNDLACMDSKGRYYIKGRLGNMIVGPSGENIYPEEIEQVINNMRGVNESLVIQRDGKLVALVKFDEKVIDWGVIEKEEKFFENIESWKKAVMDYVNKRVSKQSNIGEVDVMKEDFEKTATQKIRRFKYKFFKPDDEKKEQN